MRKNKWTQVEYMDCPDCEGDGEVGTMGQGDNMDILLYPCDTCNGTGEVEKVKESMKNKSRKYEDNKFYVGSNSILGRNWGHTTLAKAIVHAKDLMEEQNMDETFIVQIVRVVRRQHRPVEVISIK